MANSDDGERRPESRLPLRSVITRSSGLIMPLQMAVGDVKIREESRRTEIFPSVAATKWRAYTHLPAVQISRRCSSSVFRFPGVMGSPTMCPAPAGWLLAPLAEHRHSQRFS